jgi:hypothetical protein
MAHELPRDRALWSRDDQAAFDEHAGTLQYVQLLPSPEAERLADQYVREQRRRG